MRASTCAQLGLSIFLGVGIFTAVGAGTTACSSTSPSSAIAASPALDAALDDDANAGQDAAIPYPAITPPIPQAVNHGGSVIVAPKIFTVLFGTDPFASSLVDFDDDITTTPWWTSVSSEYCNADGTCIGPGTSLGHVALPPLAKTSYSDDDLQQMIQTNVTDGTFPAPSDQTMYVLFIPSGVTVTDQSQASCTNFHAYHELTSITPMGGGAPVKSAYLIITRCEDSNTLDAQTELASHEILEASTDPFLDAFYLDDVQWSANHGGEVADVCLYSGAGSASGWAVEQGFSNKMAKLGRDPCVPSDGEIDFNVAPSDGNAKVSLANGESATLHLTAFSTAATDAWTVQFIAASTSIALSPTTASLKNGDTVDVVVTKRDASTSEASFMIWSHLEGREHFWPGVVLAN